MINEVKYYIPIKGEKKRIKRTKRINMDEDFCNFTVDEDGFLHSIDDKPAFLNHSTEIVEWYNHGELHRENHKPARISRTKISINDPNYPFLDTTEEFYINNEIYRKITYDYKGNIK